MLHGLSTAFAAGDARVDPKSYPQTCIYCGQRMLCRLNPQALELPADDDTTEERE